MKAIIVVILFSLCTVNAAQLLQLQFPFATKEAYALIKENIKKTDKTIAIYAPHLIDERLTYHLKKAMQRGVHLSIYYHTTFSPIMAQLALYKMSHFHHCKSTIEPQIIFDSNLRIRANLPMAKFEHQTGHLVLEKLDISEIKKPTECIERFNKLTAKDRHHSTQHSH